MVYYWPEQCLQILNSLLDESTVLNNPEITILFNSRQFDEEFLRLFKEKLKTKKKYLVVEDLDHPSLREESYDLFKKHYPPKSMTDKIKAYAMFNENADLSIPWTTRFIDCGRQFQQRLQPFNNQMKEEIKFLLQNMSTESIQFNGTNLNIVVEKLENLFRTCTYIKSIIFNMSSIENYAPELNPSINFSQVEAFEVSQKGIYKQQVPFFSELLSRFNGNLKAINIKVNENSLEAIKSLLSSVVCKDKVTKLELIQSGIDVALIEVLSEYRGIEVLKVQFTTDVSFNDSNDNLRFLEAMAPTLQMVQMSFSMTEESSSDYICKFFSKPCFRRVKFIDLPPLTCDQIESIISTKDNKRVFKFQQESYTVEFAKRIHDLYPYAKQCGNICLEKKIPDENKVRELLRIMKSDQPVVKAHQELQLKNLCASKEQ
ncbi:hypothetical protein FGO68_gene8404 [Halteria grandinella]|uniref:Uncharacterized protein n=1 Tax=Halteria grandinella TaxID=5974 RepID=A0A8J8NWK7_HALGN|nr:hypothetical protein FGO68_gene8404 [Halteria grandinella]